MYNEPKYYKVEYNSAELYQIVLHRGKIRQLTKKNGYGSYLVDRNNADTEAFLDYTKKLLIVLAKKNPKEFMDLYINLVDDEECKKIVTEIYNKYINKRIYSYEGLKRQKEESRMIGEVEFPKHNDGYNYIKVKDGFVQYISSGDNRAGGIASRTDSYFSEWLNSELEDLADENPYEFMEFYKTVKNDKISYKIAEQVRMEKIRKTNLIFNNIQ